MQNVRFLVVRLILAVLLFGGIAIAEGIVPSAMAEDANSWPKAVVFGETPPSNYEYAGTAQALHGFQLWHYSGGYWANQIYNIRIYDSELDMLSTGEIVHDQLKRPVRLEKDLPQKVIDYLNGGGSINDVFLRFSSDRGLNPESIFEEPTYTITGSKITIDTKLVFYVSKVPFVSTSKIPGLNVPVWQPETEAHGMVTFSIFTRSGQHLGYTYSAAVDHPIRPEDIVNAQGHLKSGKLFTVITNSGQTITRDGSEIQIGYGTFASGGAVGLQFYFPINVQFYIPAPEPPPLDTIRVHYVDEEGTALLSSEEIKPASEGPYTVTAKTITGYDLISPSSVTVNIGRNDTEHQVYFTYRKPPEPGGPVAAFTWNPTTPKAETDVQLTDLSTHPDGIPIVSWRWYVDNMFVSTKQHPTYVFKKAGTYNVMLTVTDANGRSDAVVHQVTVLAPDPKYPPVACIQAPFSIIAGDAANISSCSTDPDGEIVHLEWSWDRQGTPAAPGNLGTNDDSGVIFFMQPGSYRVYLTVTDNHGLSDSTYTTINVWTPMPIPFIDVGGTLKENRKVIVDASRSIGAMFYPIDTSKTEWTVTPLDGQAVESIKFKHNTNIGHVKELLFKEPGRYEVMVTVYNTYGTSGETAVIITIAEDVPPVADFTVQDRIYRDPNNNNKGTFVLRDMSVSMDGDFIQQRIWKYLYDSQNDGRIDNDTWIIIDNGNRTEVMIEVSEVGVYYFSLEVVEGFGQDAIPEFITPADYKRAFR